jgi:adhesin/invasin
MNIAIQATLPLTVALTPAHAGAASDQKPGAAQTHRTVLHTLAPGETVERVAARFNMTVAELRALNQGRVFANGFDNLRPGDRLEVPSAPRMTLPELNSNGVTRETLDNQDEEQARKLAGMASGTANFLTSDVNKSDAAASMARGMAASEVSAQTQEWLSRFGTARVQIDVDDKLSLASSSLDLLLPVRDEEKHLLFTQGSIHRTDDRNQANLGVGVRRFNDGYMVGVNTFFDHDLSRSHSRLGVGVEYWRDYLKLSANGYHRLSDWRTSPDLDDYQERPANGWDVRAEGWLPSMPQLGGKLTYEKYYGSEVGLFGKDNRKKNPHAVTTGVTYTPIPLLTFSAEQRRGNAGASDTQFGMQFNWSLGQSWSKQTDPSKVAAMRTLAGSRYDLVERNNNIVLEYRKKEVIRLNVARELSGAGGERKSLQVAVQSKYGLERIDWSAATLLQAGGKIEHLGGSDYQLTLPQYRTGTQAMNTYTVHGVAVDKHGNRSNRSETQVTVQAPIIDATRSTLLPTDSSLDADGKSTQVLSLTLRDTQDNLIDVPLSDLGLALNRGRALGGATVSALSRKSLGIYEVTVTAGTVPEALTLTPSFKETALASAKIAILVGAPAESTSTLAAMPNTLPADGTSPATLTFTAADASGNPVLGIADQLTFAVKNVSGTSPSTGISLGRVTETTPGVYTARLTGTKAGVLTIAPQFKGAAVGSLETTMTLVTGALDAGLSDFAAAPKSIAANGSETSTLKVTAKDAEGNPITGIAGKLSFSVKNASSSDAGSGVTITPATETAPGIYNAALSGTKADTWTVSLLLDGTAVGISDTVVLTSGAVDAGKSAFSANPKTLAADGITESQLTFTAKDAQENPVTGIVGDITFDVRDSSGSAAGSDVSVKDLKETTPGTYTAKLSGTKAQIWTLKPQLNGAALGSLSDTVTLLAGALDVGLSDFAAAPKTIAANGSATSTLKLTAKDAKNNPITGLVGKLSFSVKNGSGNDAGSAVTVTAAKETAPGTYEADLSGTKADSWTVGLVLDGAAVGLSDTVILTPGAVEAGKSAFSASPKTLAADGVAESELTFIAKDAQENPVTGIVGDITFDVRDSSGSAAGSDVSVKDLKETTPGTYTAKLSGTKAETWTLKPQLKGNDIGISDNVVLTPGAVEAGKSAFSANPKTLAADGVAESELTFIAKDAQDNPVTGIVGDITFDVRDSSGSAAGSEVSVKDLKETTPGTYTARLSGTKADTWTITPQLNGNPLSISDNVVLTPGAVEAGKSGFAAAPDTITADGVAESELTFTAKDAQDNPVAGLAADLTFDVRDSSGATHSDVSVKDLKETTPGTYTATLSGTKADLWTVTPQLKGSAIGTLKVDVTLTPGALDAGLSSFAGAPNTLEANGSDISVLTFTAKDAHDNPLTNRADKVTFSVKNSSGGDAGADVTVTDVKETSPGVYEANLSGTKADTWTVRPVFEGAAVGSLSETVTLTAGSVAPGTSSFTANPPRVLAGSGDTSKLTFTAQDAHNNPVSGIASKLKFIVEGTAGTPAPGEVDVSTITEIGTTGVYEASLGGTLVDTYTVTPQADAVDLKALATNVELYKVSPPSEANSKIEVNKDKVLADGVDQSKVMFTVRDAADSPVSGIADDITFIAKDKSDIPEDNIRFSKVTEEGTSGVYTALVTGGEHGKEIGEYTIAPSVAGNNWSLSTSVEMLDIEVIKFRNDFGTEFLLSTTPTYPETAFNGAKFNVLLNNNANPADYDWSSSESWLASKGAGAFEFISAPNGAKTATITATRKGSQAKVEHTITNRKWAYVGTSSEMYNSLEVVAECTARGMVQMDGFTYFGVSPFGPRPGPLKEWGNVNSSSEVIQFWIAGIKDTGIMQSLISSSINETEIPKDPDPTIRARLICLNK